MRIACTVEMASRQSSLSTGCLRTSLHPFRRQRTERQDPRLGGEANNLIECFNTRRAATARQDHVDAAFAQPSSASESRLPPSLAKGPSLPCHVPATGSRRHPDQPQYQEHAIHHGTSLITIGNRVPSAPRNRDKPVSKILLTALSLLLSRESLSLRPAGNRRQCVCRRAA